MWIVLRHRRTCLRITSLWSTFITWIDKDRPIYICLYLFICILTLSSLKKKRPKTHSPSNPPKNQYKGTHINPLQCTTELREQGASAGTLSNSGQIKASAVSLWHSSCFLMDLKYSVITQSACPFPITEKASWQAERQQSRICLELIPCLPRSRVDTVQPQRNSPALLAGLVTGFTTLNITNGVQLNI